MCLSSLSLCFYPLHLRFWVSLQKLNFICFWTVTSVEENEEKANTIQPPSCVFLTFVIVGVVLLLFFLGLFLVVFPSVTMEIHWQAVLGLTLRYYFDECFKYMVTRASLRFLYIRIFDYGDVVGIETTTSRQTTLKHKPGHRSTYGPWISLIPQTHN